MNDINLQENPRWGEMEQYSLTVGILDVTAGEDLKRGQYIRLNNEDSEGVPEAFAATKFSHALGVVSPFQLKKVVKKGEGLYVIVNPAFVNVNHSVDWDFTARAGVSKDDGGDACCPETYWDIEDADLGIEEKVENPEEVTEEKTEDDSE